MPDERVEQVACVGSHLLEAPITGGMQALEKGQMTVFLAGEEGVARQMTPMMEDIYQKVIYTGEMGTALIPKVVTIALVPSIDLVVHQTRVGLRGCS